MKSKLVRIAKFILYPLFYLFCLGLFGYLCFPFDDLKGRIIAEFDRHQRKSRQVRLNLEEPMRLEIRELDGYWFSGVEVSGARLIIPPKKDKLAKRSKYSSIQPKRKPGKTRSSTEESTSTGTNAAEAEGDESAAKDTGPKPTIIAIKEGHARVRILPLLIGNVKIDFNIEAFGGEISGTVPYGNDSGDLEVEFAGVKLDDIRPIRDLLGIPIFGNLNGKLELAPKEGKFNKANGKLDVRVAGIVVGDGKTELKGFKLPVAKVGELTIEAIAKDGTLKIKEINAGGHDLELRGEGKVWLREPWSRCRSDMYLMFKFADSYRDQDDATRGLLGKPGTKMRPGIEFDSKVRSAKRDDGFYGWHIHGELGKLKFEPQAVKGKARSRARPARRSKGKGISTRPPSLKGVTRPKKRPLAKKPAPPPRPEPKPEPPPEPKPEPAPKPEARPEGEEEAPRPSPAPANGEKEPEGEADGER